MGVLIQFDEVPVAFQNTGNRAQRERRCPHGSLVFSGNDVTCRRCGKQWLNYLKPPTAPENR